MGEVVKLVKTGQADTKQVTYEHGGQKYTCSFDANMPAGQQWVWFVDYVQKYRYVGSAPTLDKAASGARRKIHTLNKRQIDRDEA